MKKILLLALFIVTATFLSGCNDNQDSSKETNKDKLKIYTTVYALQDFTEKIGGDYVEVDTVYPPGTDEHSFDPSQKDIISMANSDLFFYIGHNLEGFVTKAKPILVDEGVNVVAVGEAIELEEATHEEETENSEHSHDHGTVDPHIWIDPVYASEMAEIIKNELSEKMPEQADYFNEQYKKLASRLASLDQKFTTTIQDAKTKKMIVSHDAFGYWEDRYGLEEISVTGLTENEPSQKDLETIVKTAEKNNLKYVIFEQNISSKLTTILQKEIGAEALTLHNLSVLTEDDLNNGEDYFSLMEKNIKTLNTALN